MVGENVVFDMWGGTSVPFDWDLAARRKIFSDARIHKRVITHQDFIFTWTGFGHRCQNDFETDCGKLVLSASSSQRLGNHHFIGRYMLRTP